VKSRQQYYTEQMIILDLFGEIIAGLAGKLCLQPSIHSKSKRQPETKELRGLLPNEGSPRTSSISQLTLLHRSS
jgi:hypothetical protein